ncbi:MAG: hypothetical protein IKU07_01790 [Oscillospiraceae bacterium]|nr:hypothetical protein [Oscillospiraceae bacterium]
MYANFFSLRFPSGTYVHYTGKRKIGESVPTFDNRGLVHYNWRRAVTGKMIRSFFGEPNHYDQEHRVVGYTRPDGLLKLRHYNKDGSCVGYTYSFFGIFLLHSFFFEDRSKNHFYDSVCSLLYNNNRKKRGEQAC